MRVLIIFSLLCASYIVKGQSPYQGGSGDGYAMGESNPEVLYVSSQINSIQLYLLPMPFHAGDKLSVKFPEEAIFDIAVYDNTGKIIYKGNQLNSASALSDFDTRFLNAGLYLIKVSTPSYEITKRLVVYSE